MYKATYKANGLAGAVTISECPLETLAEVRVFALGKLRKMFRASGVALQLMPDDSYAVWCFGRAVGVLTIAEL